MQFSTRPYCSLEDIISFNFPVESTEQEKASLSLHLGACSTRRVSASSLRLTKKDADDILSLEN